LNAASRVRMVLRVIYTEISSARLHERGSMFEAFKPRGNRNIVSMWTIFRKNYYKALTF